MPDTDLQQLLDAVARNTGAVLSLPSAGMLRHQKARFLAVADDGFWMECSPEDSALIDQLIKEQKPAGISFKTAQVKSVFTALLLERMNNYQVNAYTTTSAVRFQLPTSIKQMQRRSNYRVRVPAESEIMLDVWRIAPRVPIRDKPAASSRVDAKLLDISTGGIGVLFVGSNGEAPKVCCEDRLRVAITSGETDIVLEGTMRPLLPGADPMKFRTGIAFKGLDNNLEGRQSLAKLTKIVGELQRQEARRARLGTA